MGAGIALAIVGALCVVAAVIIGLGLLLRSTSAGMLKVKIWRDGSWPFHLMLDDALDGDRYRPALGAAIDYWNRIVPGVFVPPGAIQVEGSVVPVLPHTALVEWRHSRLAWTRISVLKGRIWSAAIYIDTDKASVMAQGSLRRAFIHELGHVIGLGHAESSVMAPHLGDYHERLSEQDKTAIRAIYS